jgi:hypothetical protein
MDDIRMDLREMGWENVDWMNLAREREQWRSVLSTVIILLVP